LRSGAGCCKSDGELPESIQTTEHVISRSVLICALMAFCCSPVVAFESNLSISQFTHRAWSTREGAPGGVRTIAQTIDGYLWIGTNHGLFRFDGFKFERYEPQEGVPFPARQADSLLALANGDLWIGFNSGGISLLRNGIVTNYAERDGVPSGRVAKFALDREGTIWAAIAGGLARFKRDRWERIGKDWNYPGKAAQTVFVDRLGTLWVATEDTVVFLPAGEQKFQPTGEKVIAVGRFNEGANGRLWMAETSRSVRPVVLAVNRQTTNQPEIQVGSADILVARDGSLWVTTLGDGLRRAPMPERLNRRISQFSNEVEIFTSKDGLTTDYVTSIFEDREGNIWVGTNNGLDQFRKGKLTPVTLPAGFQVIGLAPAENDEVWASSWTKDIGRIQSNTWKKFRPISLVSAIYRAPSRVTWLGVHAGLIRIEANGVANVALPPGTQRPYVGPMQMTEDHAGVLWVSFENAGLYSRKGNVWKRFQTPPEISKEAARVAFTDSQARVWFGFGSGRLALVEGNGIQIFSSQNGLLVGGVNAVYGLDRNIWVGGERGLAVFDGSRFHTIVPADVDSFGGVSGIAQTENGDLWMSEFRGVVHICAAELQKTLMDHSYRVHYELFDLLDGLPGEIQESRPFPTAIQANDNRLWFSTTRGIVWLDPEDVSRNSLPPPVSIRALTAGNQQYAASSNLELPARTTSIQISYIALSLSVPERNQFRYKLDGVEDWQDAGTRREAFYTNLRPGKYRFHVIASNNDGVWNEEGVVLEFSIAPAWYQTRLFLLACIVAGLFVVWVIYNLRVRQVARAISGRFNERLAERTRIARELHDTLLQTVQGSKLVADDALEKSNESVPVDVRQALERLSKWLGQATQEGRAALNSLRTSSEETGDLTERLRRATEECVLDRSMAVKVSDIGDRRDMHPIARDEIYHIGYEAIRNACEHGAASELEITVTYAQDLTLHVRDNGSGMEPAVLMKGREGHFGLQGMRERAQRIGGKFSLNSSPNSGTEMTLVVPGKIVFRSASIARSERIKDFFGLDRSSDLH
jgi:signal transduction histidine kinase